MSGERVVADPDAGIPDLVHSLTDDSKRLLNDELRLAKIEMRESVHRAGRGALWLGVAFGLGVIALVAFTLFLSTLLGRWMGHHYWFGALVTGVIELALAAWLIKRGISAFGRPSYTLEQTRESLKDTAHWASNARSQLSERVKEERANLEQLVESDGRGARPVR